MFKKCIIFLILLTPMFISAQTDKVFLGQSIRIADFVFNDDYTPSTTTCTISVYNPSGTIKVNEATMQTQPNGWHYYDYSVPINESVGRWPVIMSCGSLLNQDLVKVNKDFIAEVDNTLSTTTIAASVSESVWSNPIRALTDYNMSGIADAVWNSSTRTLTSFGTLVNDIWNATNRSLTDYAVSSIASAVTTSVWSNPTRTLTDYGNDISATDVWLAANRSLTDYATSSISSSVWSSVNRSLTDYSTSSVASAVASSVWLAPSRLLTDYSTSSIASAVTSSIWSNPSRTLTDYGNNISVNDIWNATNRSLTDYATSSIASSVWLAPTRGLTDYGNTNLATETANMVWNQATSQLTGIGTIGKLLADNIDTQISSRGTSSLTALDVWNAATRTLTDYNSSTLASAVSTSVWANANRELTSYGNDISATDVWNVLLSNLTTVNSIGKLLSDNIDSQVSTRATLSNQQAGWSVNMSDFATVQTGKVYRAKVSILNNQSIQTNPFSTPTITLHDASRNIIVSNVPMTNISNGIYEYTYTVPSTADQGVWEAIVNTEVESGKVISTNDYWLVAGSPAQVIINGVTMSGNIATANLTVTNEGLTGYEYQYEWCVVTNVNNNCGGGDDIYRGTGAKFINPGEDWNTNLTSTINTVGDYYYKVIVYFGTEKSGSSRTFNVSSLSNNNGGGNNTSGGGSGGGGGGGISSLPTNTSIKEVSMCNGADLNNDKKVNVVDFSILLAFWKTNPPYKNVCVDINKDNKVNTSDFSIMLSQWGTKGIKVNIK